MDSSITPILVLLDYGIKILNILVAFPIVCNQQQLTQMYSHWKENCRGDPRSRGAGGGNGGFFRKQVVKISKRMRGIFV